MTEAHIIAAYGLSGLGAGDDALGIGQVGERARIGIAFDPRGHAEGLQRPQSARVDGLASGPPDRATQLLLRALRGCFDELDTAYPGWRTRRIGLAVGTSSGAMESAQHVFGKWGAGLEITKDEARAASYFAPLQQVMGELGVAFASTVQVLGACASSTIAVGLGTRWLQLGRCDLVIAAGYDALSSFVSAGFESLSATTATLPRPFRRDRDGMALGEGAAALALVLDLPAVAAEPIGRGRVLGFGISSDAVHLTAPDRTGRGLARAVQHALADACVAGSQIDLVSAHATATSFNDAAEARALGLSLGPEQRYLVHPLKAQIGHTLGAAGLLETISVAEAMRREIGPAAAGEGEVDPACAVPLLTHSVACRSALALKLSSAFGGINAALVLGPPAANAGGSRPLQRRRERPVYLGLHRTLHAIDPARLVDLLARRHPHPHRPDALAKWVIAAVDALGCAAHREGARRDPSAGLIVGHTLATLESNCSFELRRRARGARFVEGRRFPATSPNAAAGECAIAFGLEGPTFAVGASLHGGLEALAVARDLIAAGDADSMLVVCVHLAGPVSNALLALLGATGCETGATAAYLHARAELAGPASVPVPAWLPAALDAGRTGPWDGVTGPAELSIYLSSLQKPVL